MEKVDLGSGPVPKLLIRLALPAVIAQIINMLYNMVDRMYVGAIENVGTSALAGLGVAMPVILIVTAFSALIGLGGAPLVAIRLGEKKQKEAEKILNSSITVLLILGVFLTVVLLLFSRPILVLFGAPPKGLDYGNDYLQIYAIGTVFVMIAMGLNSYISTQGFAFTSMITVAVGAVLNIALDPLFIFTFNLGVKGAAIATVISQGVSAVWVFIFFLSKRSNIRVKPRYLKPDLRLVLSVLALGTAPFIMQATESAVQIVFNVQLNAYTGGNENYTAALTIMLSVMQMIVLPLNGMGTGAQPLISYNYGAGKMDRVKKTVRLLFSITFVICLIIWILCLSCPFIFARIFSATEEVTAIISRYMPIFMMGTIMFCAQFALQSAFLALGQTKISMSLAVLRKIVLLIPLAFVFPLFAGVKGIFLAEGVADLTAGAITFLTFVLCFKKILAKRAAYLEKEALLAPSGELPFVTSAEAAETAEKPFPDAATVIAEPSETPLCPNSLEKPFTAQPDDHADTEK